MADRLPELLDLLDSQGVRDRIRFMIDELGGVSATDTDAIIVSINARLNGIAESLRDVVFDDDTTEAYTMLPWIWLELRFEWMRYNMQMQYQTVTQGIAAPALMARGAALSFVLEAVELHLSAESAFLVQKIAADPAGTARGAIERTERLFALLATASAGGRAAVDSLLMAQDQITRHTNSAPVRQELNKAVSAVIESLGGALRVSHDDFSHALEGVFIRELGQAAVHVALALPSPDYSLTVPSAVANALIKGAADWMRALGSTSLVTSAEARLAGGRPAHVTLTAVLRRDGDRVALVMSDDGDGIVDYRPDWRRWPIRDLKLSLAQRPGEGSTLTMGCDVTSISEYMMLRVGSDAHDAIIGVPVSMVDHIEQRDAAALAVQGSRLVDRNSGSTMQLIDLGASLFREAIPSSLATYVLVRPDGPHQPAVALRVRGVEGVCRGSVKHLPEIFTDSPLRGFVQYDHHLISILDFNRLLQREELHGPLISIAA